MAPNLISAAVIGGAVVIAAFVIGGRFSLTTSHVGENSYVIVVDRFTGSARVCVPGWCRAIPEQQGPIPTQPVQR
jgi:hypothetical protein